MVTETLQYYLFKLFKKISEKFANFYLTLTNTIWYLQFHFVCAKLFTSMFSFFIDKILLCVFLTGRSFLLYHIGGFFSSSVNLFLNHATIAWFSLYKKQLQRNPAAVFLHQLYRPTRSFITSIRSASSDKFKSAADAPCKKPLFSSFCTVARAHSGTDAV